jgi:hypothetical protein
LTFSSTLKMETVCSSDMLGSLQTDGGTAHITMPFSFIEVSQHIPILVNIRQQ